MANYATLNEFIARFPNTRVSSVDLDATWLTLGTTRVNEVLGKCFTIPFSSNNQTAKELSIEFAYLGILQRTRAADSDEMLQLVTERVTNICSGNAPMVTTGGDAIFATGVNDSVWSNTKDFTPVFDMRRPERQRVDPDLLDELESRDR